jgi:MraZ protein
MFYGEYEHTLDRKGRLIIPSGIRRALKEHYSDKVYLTRGLEQCLFAFPEDEWKLQEQKFKNFPLTKVEARKFNRLYFSGACELECDKQGRILIPNYLKQYALIQRKVMIIGVSNRFEIWDFEKWQEFYAKSRESFEEIAERLNEMQ